MTPGTPTALPSREPNEISNKQAGSARQNTEIFYVDPSIPHMQAYMHVGYPVRVRRAKGFKKDAGA